MNPSRPAHPKRCQVHALGTLPFLTARHLQEALARQIARGERPPCLLLLQHPPTYTFGRRGDEAHLLWSEDELEARGVSLYWTDRGGDVTYHGPGQLVGYPLLPLGSLNAEGRIPQADYVGYLRRLEMTLLQALERLGLEACLLPDHTGVWIAPNVILLHDRREHHVVREAEKIASIGVKIDPQGVSRHGFALNVDPDMTYWEGIVACGLAGYEAISLADLVQPPPTMAQVKRAMVRSFADVFNFEIVEEKDETVLRDLLLKDPHRPS
jgi:lipoyl(octanoyl) transferase